MVSEPASCNPEKFEFRGLHTKVLMGTASDRYKGWIGQIYSSGRHDGYHPLGKPGGICHSL
jgi:hypothetical protein